MCRDRSTRTLLGFLPILGKGYTAAETDTDAFRDRSYEVIQQALEIVCISDGIHWTSARPQEFVLQMFAPLLEPGNVRDGFVVLMDPAGNYRKFGLRIGMLMADIPEICCQLGVIFFLCQLQRSLSILDIQGMSARYPSSYCFAHTKALHTGVLNSVMTTYPCYKCLAPRDMMHDFSTPFDLRHTGLIEYHVKKNATFAEDPRSDCEERLP